VGEELISGGCVGARCDFAEDLAEGMHALVQMGECRERGLLGGFGGMTMQTKTKARGAATYKDRSCWAVVVALTRKLSAAAAAVAATASRFWMWAAGTSSVGAPGRFSSG
jgi:hypothetical protein